MHKLNVVKLIGAKNPVLAEDAALDVKLDKERHPLARKCRENRPSVRHDEQIFGSVFPARELPFSAFA